MFYNKRQLIAIFFCDTLLRAMYPRNLIKKGGAADML